MVPYWFKQVKNLLLMFIKHCIKQIYTFNLVLCFSDIKLYSQLGLFEVRFACLLTSEGCDRVELVQTTTKWFVTCSKPGGRCALSFWMRKCISWTILLTNIACFINMISVHGSGQFLLEFDLVLLLSLKTDVYFSLHDNLGYLVHLDLDII